MKIRNAIMLLLAALIWGVAFVAQSVGMDYVGPFTFNSVRSFIGAIVLLPYFFIRKKEKEDQSGKTVYQESINGQLILGGIVCGGALAAASMLQQIGIMYTSVGKAGFITACYIVIVPILGIFLKKRSTWKVWISVFIAVAGLYFLCMSEKMSVGKGDALIFLCAVMFSVHILAIDYFSPKTDGVMLSCLQFFVCSMICGIVMLLVEKPEIGQIMAAWQPILYAGVMSCGVAYTLQIIGQKGMNPTVASLLLSMESVISVLAGLLILHQHLSAREILGCVFMFIAIILAQL